MTSTAALGLVGKPGGENASVSGGQLRIGRLTSEAVGLEVGIMD